MAQIDELIAAMLARRADALILNSDQPAQLSFNGVLAQGAIVPATLLREMLCEMLPADQKFQLVKADDFEFLHACPSGLMRVQITGRDTRISLVISPHQTAFSQLAYFPVTGSGYAPHKAPDLSKLGSVVANSTSTNSIQKPRVGVVPVLGAMAVYFIGLRILTPLLGGALPWLFFFLVAVGILADASLLGVRKGLVDGWADLEPWQWFFLCLIFNFVGIPAYFAARPVYKSVIPPARVPPP